MVDQANPRAHGQIVSREQVREGAAGTRACGTTGILASANPATARVCWNGPRLGPLEAMDDFFLAVIAAALLVLIVSATLLVNTAVSSEPTSLLPARPAAVTGADRG